MGLRGRAAHFSASLVAVAGSVALDPMPATAATVSVSEGSGSAGLTYEATPGEHNRLTITATLAAGGSEFDGWIVKEEGWIGTPAAPIALVLGPGCTSVDAESAFCDITEPYTHAGVSVVAGDAGDSVDVGAACGSVDDVLAVSCGATVYGGSGEDVLTANDMASYRTRSVLQGHGGSDILYAGTSGSILGGDGGDDRLHGAGGTDRLGGEGGSDWISGGGGADFPEGGSDDDTIWGGPGKDTIRGGRGRDDLRGSAGDDFFYSRDRYRDVVRGGTGRDRGRVSRNDVTRSIERVFFP